MFPKKIRVLVVDDMAMFRAMVKQSLTALDYNNFSEFPDGEAAWSALAQGVRDENPFGLIISDWTMPKMKGIELLKRVRAESWGQNLPFILLTGETDKENIMEAVRSGVTQYMIKPFTVNDFQTKLRQAYEKTKNQPNVQQVG